MFLPVFIKRANDAAGVARGDAIGRDAAVYYTSGSYDAVVPDGDIGQDDAAAADEAVRPDSNWSIDYCFRISVR